MHKKNVIITVIWMLVYICFCRYFLSIVKKIWVSNTKQANKQATNNTDKTNKQTNKTDKYLPSFRNVSLASVFAQI
jgi:beta-lactamase regulating signal transducer with metallopeptidase domain